MITLLIKVSEKCLILTITLTLYCVASLNTPCLITESFRAVLRLGVTQTLNPCGWN